nr:hypothetical protein [Tanacetum cinerariifolium]
KHGKQWFSEHLYADSYFKLLNLVVLGGKAASAPPLTDAIDAAGARRCVDGDVVTLAVEWGVRRRLEVKADSGGDVGVVEGIDPVDLRWNIAMMASAATVEIRPKKMGAPKKLMRRFSSVALASAEGPIPLKTVEQKLARKNELKAKSTLMLAIPNEHLLKFHTCKDEKSLWEAIKNRFGGNKESKKTQKTILKKKYKNFVASGQEGLDKTYDRFQKLISQLEIHDLEQIDTDDLEEINLKWQVAMISMRVERFIQKIGRKLDLNGKETVGFDRTKVECYNCHMRGHFARECKAPRNQGNRNRDAPTRNAPVDTSTTNSLVVQDGIGGYDWSFQAEKELTNFDLMAHTSQGSSSSSGSNSENLAKLIKSQISAINKTGIGYDGQKNKSDLNDIHVNESEVLNSVFDSRKSDEDDNQVNDMFKKSEVYHVVPPPYTRNYMPSRADLSFVGLNNSVFKSKESHSKDENVFEPKEVKKTVKPSLENIKFVNSRNTTVENENKAKKPRKFSQSLRVLIKSRQVPVNTVKQSSHRAATLVSTSRHVNTAASRPNVNSALPTTYSYFKANSLVRRPFNKKSAAKTNNFNEKVNTAKVNNVTTVGPKALVSAAERNRHMTRNKSYLTDYQEIDGGFVAFGGNAKGGKIRTGNLDLKTCILLMHKKFQMSSMGELTFFLGLHSCREMMEFLSAKTTKDVDVHLYRSMIGSLMYLTTSWPDIMFVVCACARFQATPKVSHLYVVKRIFIYLKGQPKLGLWYPRDLPFDLEAFQIVIMLELVLIGNPQQEFWQTATTRKLDNGEMEITATIDGKVKVVTEASVRRHLKLEDSDGISILPTEIFEQLALMGYVSNSDKLTFQKGYFSPQWRFLIHTILHCLSSKKTSWDQFSSNIATALILFGHK